MKKAYIVFLHIFLIVCGTIPISKGQSEKQIIEADTVKTRVLKANYIHADTVKTKTIKTNRAKYVNSKTVRIDFDKKKLYKLPKIEEGKFYQVQIDDINMNLYSVTVENKDTVITSDVTFPTFEILGLETLEEMFDVLSSASLPSVLAEKNFADTVDSNKIIKLNGEKKTEKEVRAKLQDITEKLNNYVTELDTEKIKILKFAMEIDTLMLDVQTMALSYLVERDKTWQQELKNDLGFRKFIEASEEYRNKVYRLLTKLKQKRTEYLDFYESNNEIIDDSSELRKTDDSIKKAFNAAINQLDKTFQAINAEKVSEWLNSIIHLDNNKERTYRSLPIQLKGDFTDLSIDIKPKDEKFGLPSYHTNLRFPYPPKWQIAASTGIYRSFRFSDDAYSISATKIDSTSAEIEIKDENPSNWEIGTAALFHWNLSNIINFLDFSEKLQLQITMGPAISLTKPVKPRMLFGGGAAFGDKHKLTLNILLVAGNVDRLSKNYSLSEAKEVSIDQIPNNVTVSKFKWGWGLSVGYMYNF